MNGKDFNEDWIHVDNVEETVIENWWFSVDDIIRYINERGSKDPKFARELIEKLRKVKPGLLWKQAVFHKILVEGKP